MLTGAEWITTRFGNDRGGKLSHISVVIFALVSVVGFMGYAFQGIGKFAVVFFPWDLTPNTYAVIFMTITTAYVLVGGMYSVVLTDVVKYLVMTVMSFIIGFIAISKTTAVQIEAAVPAGWKSLGFGWKLDLDWTGLLDSLNGKMDGDGFGLFGIFFMMILLSTTAFALGFIEPLRDIYFFKNVTAIEEEKTYPVFNTSSSIGAILGRIIISCVLLILPKNYMFLIMAICMFVTVMVSLKLKEYYN